MTTITLCVPSRGRPEGCAGFVESALMLADDPARVDILVGLDECDPHLARYREIVPRAGARISIGKRTNVNATFDRLMDEAEGEIVGWGADDLRVATQGWDSVTTESVGAFGFWSPHVNGHSARACAAYPFVSKDFERRIRAAQGFVTPPFFPFWFGDTWLDDLAMLLARRGHMAWRYDQSGNGLTRGMRDLRFWGDVFVAYRPARISAAVAIFGDERVRPMVEFIGSMVRFDLAPEVVARAEMLAEPEVNPHYEEQKRRVEQALAELRAA